eukprot:gene20394-27166_t
MQELINGGLVEGLPSISHKQLQRFALDPCDACCVGKATKESFPERRRVTHAPLELIHVDLQGPFCIGIRMEVYLLVAVDDHSGWNAVEPLPPPWSPPSSPSQAARLYPLLLLSSALASSLHPAPHPLPSLSRASFSALRHRPSLSALTKVSPQLLGLSDSEETSGTPRIPSREAP